MVTWTRSPPTARAKSAMMEKLATTSSSARAGRYREGERQAGGECGEKAAHGGLLWFQAVRWRWLGWALAISPRAPKTSDTT